MNETLTQLRAQHRDLFYSQNWFAGERFMDLTPSNRELGTPIALIGRGRTPISPAGLVHAVDLAHAYVLDPTNPIWKAWLWTRDTDSEGQRIFLGVKDDRLEIHRHIHLTTRFGMPTWK